MSTQLLGNLIKDTNNDKTERLKKKKGPETSVKSWIHPINPGLFNSRFLIK